MKRIQAFEFNERHECPNFVKDGLIEILGNGLRWGYIYDGVGPYFNEFCRKARCKTALDLCSGTGEPVSILIEALQLQGVNPPDFIISDLFPKVHAMQQVADRHKGKVKVIHKPVDATNVSKNLSCGARTIISAFHHFPPDIAKQILADCVLKKEAIFIMEGFPRSLRRFLPMLPTLTPALFLNPFLTKKDNILKGFFTYFFPLIQIFGLWDAIVSVCRIYSKEELFEMAYSIDKNYNWQYHEVPFFPGGRAYIFWGHV